MNIIINFENENYYNLISIKNKTEKNDFDNNKKEIENKKVINSSSNKNIKIKRN
jgi:hypothetical protein